MTKQRATVLAIDIGAESGRVMAVHFDGSGLELEEVHRFPNHALTVNGTLQWDILHLWREVQAGIARHSAHAAGPPASLGLDTWGVDFGLLDRNGDLIGNPVCYRDSRTEGMLEAVFAHVPRTEVFAQTGMQVLEINTLYQMMSLVERGSPHLQIATRFLTVPDLLNFWLSGVQVCEFSIASTTQMLNPFTRKWAGGLLDALGIPLRLFPEVVQPGTRLGTYEGIPVIAPACHDTGSAVAGVPVQAKNFAYISSGTWSLVGLEVAQPVVNEAALAVNASNEGGVYGTFRLLKNVMGLWLLQQCRAAWESAGRAYSYPQLVALAETADPLRSFVDPDDGRFLPPGDHPAHIRDFCALSGQPLPQSDAAIARCVFESLALAYRDVFIELGSLTGRKIEVIHVVGGGSRNRLLNQFTADATGIPVLAGPGEATVIGNALVQLISLGELANLEEGRQLVSEIGALERFEPVGQSAWQEIKMPSLR
ncbi:MAG: rhamnulokinase [Caldilineaceae bacterium]|nr:rhamnulokinase [Caldilineaceae bacterium]